MSNPQSRYNDSTSELLTYYDLGPARIYRRMSAQADTRVGIEIPNGYNNFVDQKVLANGVARWDWRPAYVIPLSGIMAADKYALGAGVE